MDPSSWSPYSQQYSHLSSGSPQRSLALPSSLPREDPLNSYGGTNSHPLLMSSCQGLPSLPPRPSTADPTVHSTGLLSPPFDTQILSPPLHSSKETPECFNDNVYNGVCKENQSGLRSFIQTSGSASRNESSGFTTSDNSNSGFGSQVPPITFHSSAIDRPSPGPFGVLPHEAVMTRQTRFDRSNDKFIPPVSKPLSTSFSSGSYVDQDVNSAYTSASLPTQTSVFTNDTSHSPIVNPVNSPNMSNFSSPNDYYSSPKPNFGAYNSSMQSPVPQSPSVAQHSYPSSPFPSVDSVNHASSAPPCSPISSSTYVNNLPDRGVIVSQVPHRNGHKSQHSPSSTTGGNSVICYTPQQTQSVVHHGSQPAVSKTPDYHADYSVFPHDHTISPPYSSVYPALHSTQATSGSNPRISPRGHGPLPSTSHDNRLPYAHLSSVPHSPISSPTYLQNKAAGNHEASFGTCSSSVSSGQSMHASTYPQCTPVIDSLRHRPLHHGTSSLMQNHMSGDRQFNYQPSDINDDKNTLDMFNSHVDSGVHNPDNCQSSIDNFLESDLPILDPDVLSNRQLRMSESGQHPSHHSSLNIDASGRGIITHTHMTDVQNELSLRNNIGYSYNPNIDLPRTGSCSYGIAPKKKGRRGRRRKVDINYSGSYQYSAFKNERNVIFRNGFPVNNAKFSEYGNSNYYNSTYPKGFKERNELHSLHLSSSRLLQTPYGSAENENKNCPGLMFQETKLFPSIEDDLRFLEKFSFVDDEEEKEMRHTFMKTRNKDTEGFLQSFLNFLEVRKITPESDGDASTYSENPRVNKEHRGRSRLIRNSPKVIIRMGRCNNPGEWRLTETSVSPERFSDSYEESASMDSNINMSSHQIESKHADDSTSSDDKNSVRTDITGNIGLASERLSKNDAKRNFEFIDGFDKYSDITDNHLHFTNSETLPAGKMKAKTDSGGNDLRQSSTAKSFEKTNISRKRGRKAKTSTTTVTAIKQKVRRSTLRAAVQEPARDSSSPEPESAAFTPVAPVDISVSAARRSSLRVRKEDIAVKEEQIPGTSIKSEPIDLPMSSDDADDLDDSDSDPAWTPSARTPKVSEPVKPQNVTLDATVKKQRRKKIIRRNSSSALSLSAKKKKEKSGETVKKKVTAVKTKSLPTRNEKVKDTVGNFKVRNEKRKDHFVIAKGDINKDKPSIWRVDNDMHMLQRFDPNDEQGIQLHRNTYTYAAWNEVSEHNYIKVNVRVLARSSILYVVQYLGPEPPEPPVQSSSCVQQTIANPLRENFEVFLQTLISQALDPNFLSEITNENDEYFLSNIKEVEKVTEEKKSSLVKETWDQELRKCADTYPCVNILPCMDTEEIKCQVCNTENGKKLVQFYGQPYDWTTLGSIETPVSHKTQFNVCAICSATVSLYNRLHHQKYNFFIKCRTKMNQVKGNDETVESHVLLEHCLQDTIWVNQLFQELEEIWKECDKKS